MKQENVLRVSEIFYSIQGEGPSMGSPAVFLRLQNCNLLCQWQCDTIDVWRKGKLYTTDELLNEFNWNYLYFFKNGAHLVITGGEPTLQQDILKKFLTALRNENYFPYTEIETNGTILIKDNLMELLNQVNCSPKTSNSGVKKEVRYKPEILKKYAKNKKVYFKFVIESELDMDEIMNDFIHKFKIPNDRVYLMPECLTKKELKEKHEMVIELCKKYGFRYSDRLHIRIWDKTTGV